jgi:hypothetical protein
MRWKGPDHVVTQKEIAPDTGIDIASTEEGALACVHGHFDIESSPERTVPGVVSEMNTAVESAIGKLVSTIPALPAPPIDNADTSAAAHW